VTAVQDPDGRWIVVAGKRLLAGPFDSSAGAWRWIERQSGEAVSKAEERADWFFRETLR
jgi:hypothetical protein